MAFTFVVDELGDPVRLTTRVEAESGKGYSHPEAHAVMFGPDGRILISTRGDKRFLRHIRTILSAGGHIDGRDVYPNEIGNLKGKEIEGKVYLDYVHGVARETNEELGTKILPNRFKRIMKSNFDFTDLCNYPNYGYIEVYSVRYDPKTDGKIKPNKSEIEKVEWLSLEDIRKREIHKTLGRLGERVFNEIEPISNEIRREKSAVISVAKLRHRKSVI